MVELSMCKVPLKSILKVQKSFVYFIKLNLKSSLKKAEKNVLYIKLV